MATPITVSRLRFYPIKSCAGIDLTEARLDARGIVGDRAFMVVDESNHFITQREAPLMALIEPRVIADGVFLFAPGMPGMNFRHSVSTARREVVIFHETCTAVDQGEKVAEWLTAFLGRPCRLVRMADDFVRPVDPQYATADSNQVGFADAYPLLLASESSLDDLNSRMSVAVPMERFRPNIVVKNAEAFAEDSWRDIRIGSIDAAVVKACVRCVITTVDHKTGRKGKEPLTTLATYRRFPSGGVIFAQNVIHSSNGIIKVGDEVSVLS